MHIRIIILSNFYVIFPRQLQTRLTKRGRWAGVRRFGILLLLPVPAHLPGAAHDPLDPQVFNLGRCPPRKPSSLVHLFTVHCTQSCESQRGSFYRFLERLHVQVPSDWLPLVHLVPELHHCDVSRQHLELWPIRDPGSWQRSDCEGD